MRPRIVTLAVLLLVVVSAALLPAQAQGPCGPVYTVVQGDTLFSIARRCGLTVSQILAANPGIFDPNRILIGQRIVLPQPGVTPAPQPGFYVVRAGDTLFSIARRFGVTVSALLAVNPQIADPNVIHEGQVLVIPPPGFIPPTPTPTPIVPTPTPTATPSPTPPPQDGIVIQVFLHFIALGAGDLGCGDAIVAVPREVAPTRAPLTAALQELLGTGASVPGRPDLYNAIGQSNLQVEAIDVVGDTAIVRLVGNYQIGGVCDEPRVRAQLERTVLQFAAVRQAVIFINGVRLEDLLGAQG
jgi:LysM repeat protein